MENLTQKIHGLLAKFDTAMLVTHAGDLSNRARPMGIARLDPACDVWFFTSRQSGKAHEIAEDQNVLLVFQKDHSCYASLSGRAKLVAETRQIEALWKESYRTWFPDGIDDPNLILIRVAPVEVEYWDNTGLQGVKYLLEAAKARLSGERAQVEEPEQHGRVKMG